MNYSKKLEFFIVSVMKWLELHFLQTGQLHYAELLVKKFLKVLRTRGKKEAIRFCKESRASVYQWLTTIDSLDQYSRSSSTVGLPRHLRFLRHMESLGHPFIRLILSSLYVSRGLSLPVSPNVESITRPPLKGFPDLSVHIGDFWKDLGYSERHRAPRSVLWKRFHLSTKSGPNGQALWSAVADLSSLPESLKESIWIVGGKKLESRMKVLSNHLELFYSWFKVSGGRCRKIVAIPDQEGKTREVAILDYWSQTALRGLHNYLFRVLKKIPQDCTFDQGGFKPKVEAWVGGHKFHSVDLTTATDRFPIQLISQVLEGVLGKCYVHHWRNIMVGYPFKVAGRGDEEISYSVGNPMGAYSSWNSFAVTHHYVVYYCCRELGIKYSEAPYVLLGDDIVIKHDDLARKYMEVMTLLGVEFSLQKSHVSHNMFEFAKRTFHLGSEITPFPVAALWSTRRTPSLALNVVTNESDKGWTSPLDTPAVLSELYRVLGFNATYVAKKRQIFFIAHQVMVGIRGVIPAAQVVRNVLVEYYPRVLSLCESLPFDAGDRVAEYWFMKMFRDSLLSSVDPKKGEKPLGLIAEQLVCLITGRDDTAMDAFDLIQAIPVLQIHGQIEEVYMAVVKGGDEQLRLALNHDWKMVLRSMTIPISDKVYVSRNQDVLVHASFTLAKILRSTIEAVKSPKDLFAAMRTGLRRPF